MNVKHEGERDKIMIFAKKHSAACFIILNCTLSPRTSSTVKFKFIKAGDTARTTKSVN